MHASNPPTQALGRSLAPIAVLTLVWGCNWPILKIGVSEIAPLTFRALTLPFAAIGMLAVARWAGDGIRIPREWWPKVAWLALLNIAGWNGFVLFGVQQLPAGRSAILAYTMPLWATLLPRSCCTSRSIGARSSDWRSACAAWASCSATSCVP